MVVVTLPGDEGTSPTTKTNSIHKIQQQLSSDFSSSSSNSLGPAADVDGGKSSRKDKAPKGQREPQPAWTSSGSLDPAFTLTSSTTPIFPAVPSSPKAALLGANLSLRCSVFGIPSAVVSWWQAATTHAVGARSTSGAASTSSGGVVDGDHVSLLGSLSRDDHVVVVGANGPRGDPLPEEGRRRRRTSGSHSRDQRSLEYLRLVANGTSLSQSWEDQYYSVNEYRNNAHQVRVIAQ